MIGREPSSLPARRLRVLEGPSRARGPETLGCFVLIFLAALGWLLVVAAIAAALWLTGTAFGASSLSPAQVAYWRGVARCETGSTWRGLGATYQGGLGIYAPNWDRWAAALGLARYRDAGDAPPFVQMTVAQYGYEHGGRWGCG